MLSLPGLRVPSGVLGRSVDGSYCDLSPGIQFFVGPPSFTPDLYHDSEIPKGVKMLPLSPSDVGRPTTEAELSEAFSWGLNLCLAHFGH